MTRLIIQVSLQKFFPLNLPHLSLEMMYVTLVITYLYIVIFYNLIK